MKEKNEQQTTGIANSKYRSWCSVNCSVAFFLVYARLYLFYSRLRVSILMGQNFIVAKLDIEMFVHINGTRINCGNGGKELGAPHTTSGSMEKAETKLWDCTPRELAVCLNAWAQNAAAVVTWRCLVFDPAGVPVQQQARRTKKRVAGCQKSPLPMWPTLGVGNTRLIANIICSCVAVYMLEEKFFRGWRNGNTDLKRSVYMVGSPLPLWFRDNVQEVERNGEEGPVLLMTEATPDTNDKVRKWIKIQPGGKKLKMTTPANISAHPGTLANAEHAKLACEISVTS